MKKFLLVIFMLLSMFMTSTCFAGAFGSKAGLSQIVIAEVTSYGEQTLKPQFFLTFKDLLIEQLQSSGKLAVDDVTFSAVAENDISVAHMNAIVNSKQFVREQARIDLVRYYRNLPYEPQPGSDVYQLDADVLSGLTNIAELNTADYLLFCNVKNVEVEDKHHTDTGLGVDVLQGSKVKVDIDYYLLANRSGTVYSGTSSVDKTAQVFNMIGVQYGKQLTTEQLLQNVLENQVKRISNDIIKKGLPKLDGARVR